MKFFDAFSCPLMLHRQAGLVSPISDSITDDVYFGKEAATGAPHSLCKNGPKLMINFNLISRLKRSSRLSRMSVGFRRVQCRVRNISSSSPILILDDFSLLFSLVLRTACWALAQYLSQRIRNDELATLFPSGYHRWSCYIDLPKAQC